MSRKLGVESCARLFFYFYIKWSVSYISTFARDCVCIDALINKATLVVSLFWATALSSAMWILLHLFKEVFVWPLNTFIPWFATKWKSYMHTHMARNAIGLLLRKKNPEITFNNIQKYNAFPWQLQFLKPYFLLWIIETIRFRSWQEKCLVFFIKKKKRIDSLQFYVCYMYIYRWSWMTYY